MHANEETSGGGAAPTLDAGRAVDELRALLLQETAGLVQGATEDVERYFAAVAQETVMAAAAGDEGWSRELLAQVRTLKAQHRVEVGESGWRVLQAVALTAGRLIVSAVLRVAP